jgi:hypothetical protein
MTRMRSGEEKLVGIPGEGEKLSKVYCKRTQYKIVLKHSPGYGPNVKR